MSDEWRPGVDSRLRRNVWIREVRPGEPPLDAARVAVSRPTRLRWLAGRRESHDAWDAFEAVPGVSLECACARRCAWVDVRWWLLDLARECADAAPNDKPPLRADRVWILDTGGAKLIDDPLVVRGTDPSAIGDSCAKLLRDVATVARKRLVEPWPLGAARFIESLSASPSPHPTEILRGLEPLTRRRGVLTRGRRALHVLGLVILPVLFAAAEFLTAHDEPIRRGRMPLESYVASVHMNTLRAAEAGRLTLSSSDIEALEITLASRYRHVLAAPRLTALDRELAVIWAPVQVERVLRRRPTEAQARRAMEHPIVKSTEYRLRNWSLGWWSLRGSLQQAVATAIVSLTIVALLSVLAALAFRRGLLTSLGLEIVTPDGRLASRVRVAVRAMLAWSPLIVLQLARQWLPDTVTTPSMPIASGVALLVLLAGAVFAVLRPSRSLQDRLAGTWIVPR